jgi:esterase
MALELAATEQGAGPPLAILHGLFGSGRNWATIARHLAAHYHVGSLDLRNHGASPWADNMAYAEMALVAALRGGPEVERLVVVDIAPVAYPIHHLRLVQAMRALDLGAVTRRSDADARLAAAIPDAAERGFLLQNLVFDAGRARWRLNLAAIERELPGLVGFPDHPDGAVYEGPALFVAGARSDYLLAEHEPAVRRLFPHATVERIANAGHWVHAEQPQAFLAVVERFLVARG